PVIMMVLFGFVIRNEIRGVKVAVVDLSRDEVTAAIVDKLQASEYFDVVDYGTKDIEEAFRTGSIMEAIIFEHNFASRLIREESAGIQVVTDASNPNTASIVAGYTSAIIANYLQEQAANREPRTEKLITASFRMRYNPELKSVYLFVPGLIALILMLVCALMTSITITREREMGTMEVLLVSPLRPPQIIIGKVIPYLLLSFVNVLSILILARFVFKVPLRGSILLLLLECLLFIVCALSLGILISSRSKTMQTATMIALAGLLMPTVLLSGFIFPITSMPEPLQMASHLIPAKWFLIIVRGIMIRGVGFEFIWKETLVLVGMTALFIGASVRSFNIRLD
ncbi:MAG: ABC transporter permease, partial [Rhodothermales bacterium]